MGSRQERPHLDIRFGGTDRHHVLMVRCARRTIQCLARGEPHGDTRLATAVDNLLDPAARLPLRDEYVVYGPPLESFSNRMNSINALGRVPCSALRRAGDGDADGVEQVFAFFPRFLLDFLGDFTKALKG